MLICCREIRIPQGILLIDKFIIRVLKFQWLFRIIQLLIGLKSAILRLKIILILNTLNQLLLLHFQNGQRVTSVRAHDIGTGSLTLLYKLFVAILIQEGALIDKSIMVEPLVLRALGLLVIRCPVTPVTRAALAARKQAMLLVSGLNFMNLTHSNYLQLCVISIFNQLILHSI